MFYVQQIKQPEKLEVLQALIQGELQEKSINKQLLKKNNNIK